MNKTALGTLVLFMITVLAAPASWGRTRPDPFDYIIDPQGLHTIDRPTHLRANPHRDVPPRYPSPSRGVVMPGDRIHVIRQVNSLYSMVAVLHPTEDRMVRVAHVPTSWLEPYGTESTRPLPTPPTPPGGDRQDQGTEAVPPCVADGTCQPRVGPIQAIRESFQRTVNPNPTYVPPTPQGSTRLTSRMGTRQRRVWGVLPDGSRGWTFTREFHAGVDFAPTGADWRRGEQTPVIAVRDGVVIAHGSSCPRTGGGAACGRGYGNYVAVRHSDGFVSVYAHLDGNASCTIRIPASGRVAQGQQLGCVGNTGHSTGPHLHFELRDPNRPTPRGSMFPGGPVDPLPLIGIRH